MRTTGLLFLTLICSLPLAARQTGTPQQPTRGWLTVETIMRDQKWMGTSPSRIFWSEDGKSVYFNWRRDGDQGDSLYVVPSSGGTPRRVTPEERRILPSQRGTYTRDRTKKVYARDGDLFVLDIRSGRERRLTRTNAGESNPAFLRDEAIVAFERGGNVFTVRLDNGLETQITNFVRGTAPGAAKKTPLQEYLQKESLELSAVLRERKEKRTAREQRRKEEAPEAPKPYYFGQRALYGLELSPDARVATFILSTPSRDAKNTVVPQYVTESGYTEDIESRTNVGEPLSTYEFCIYNCALDSVMHIKPDNIEDIASAPAPGDTGTARKPRGVRYDGPYWSDDGKHAFVQIFSQDNKDRWLVMLNVEKAAFGTLLDHQHDDAWVGGPGIGFFGGNSVGWMPDSKRIYFQSEASGWSHLYVVGMDGKGKRQLTSGSFEIYNPAVSRDKKHWYFSSNEVHFGERQFYSMPLEGGKRTRITTMEGRNDVFRSPDDRQLAVLYSFSNKMPELYLMPNKPGAAGRRVTDSPSAEFRSYSWRVPEVLRIKARDGAMVPARLYKPERPNGAAVIFVHGAGYLQNAHKWWSSYSHEYMFNNLLTDQGFTVLDMDYRASAGLGRDWRTAIYRHMGGKDLDDQVDGARWLVRTQGVDSARIGIYGGSYGGFITLMAMFTRPGVFAAGAALRPVTDWAHYNHGYTSAILNIPQDDSTAFRQSSPIYFAEGLKGRLLICHGMIDINVHFQDAVRLVQRLIELKKENWELAVYPMESHGFVEETSWMDEYKRILKLFDSTLLPH